MFRLLEKIQIAPSTSRTNVLPVQGVGVESVTLGLAGPRITCITNATKEYPLVFSVLNRWFAQAKLGIPYTSIQVNRGFSCARHRDRGNYGPSATKALGRFTGGRLLYWPKDNGDFRLNELKEQDAAVVDTRKWFLFDGTRAHEAKSFDGRRISVVFYRSSSWELADEQVAGQLHDLGVNLPTLYDDPNVLEEDEFQ